MLAIRIYMDRELNGQMAALRCGTGCRKNSFRVRDASLGGARAARRPQVLFRQMHISCFQQDAKKPLAIAFSGLTSRYLCSMQSLIRRSLFGVAAVTMVLSLSACRTMNRDQCVAADWRTVGFEDGVNGYTAD